MRVLRGLPCQAEEQVRHDVVHGVEGLLVAPFNRPHVRSNETLGLHGFTQLSRIYHKINFADDVK